MSGSAVSVNISGRIGEAPPAGASAASAAASAAALPPAAAAAAGQSSTGAAAPAEAPAAPLDTLDEPLSATVLRDVRAVASKLRIVLLPRRTPTAAGALAELRALAGAFGIGGGGGGGGGGGEASGSDGGANADGGGSGEDAELAAELREWDLWGPLVLCLLLSVLLSWGAQKEQAAQVFAAVFVAVWAGAAVVSANGRLLGGRVSFLQSVCVLGYCMSPLLLAGALAALAPNAWGVREAAVLGALVWSVRASVLLMGALVPRERKALALYPVALFYGLLAWLVYFCAPRAWA